MLLNNIKIVIVEPAGPLNVGSVARVMKNMGLHQLILVNPQCDVLGPEARLMAVHAVDILTNATIVPSLPVALADCQRAIATTANIRNLPSNLENPKDALPWLLPYPSALIFGREDSGLTNTELNYAQKFVKIPTDSAYTSLNLAQAVAVCCYELYQCAIRPINQSVIINTDDQEQYRRDRMDTSLPEIVPCSIETLEGYFQQLETLLLKIGYLYPHTTESRMAKFRHLYNRASPTTEEVAMLRGILSQMSWALNYGAK